MFLSVGWYVGWYGKVDQDGLYVKRTVRATELTWGEGGYFRIRPHPGGISSPSKFKYQSDTFDFDEIWIIGTKHHIRELLKISASFENCKPLKGGLTP